MHQTSCREEWHCRIRVCPAEMLRCCRLDGTSDGDLPLHYALSTRPAPPLDAVKVLAPEASCCGANWCACDVRSAGVGWPDWPWDAG